MSRLEDRVAVITGGSQGIGAAYARSFTAEGAKVVIADVAPADDLIADVEELGGTAIFIETDVTNEAAVAKMATMTVDAFGRIDVLVNNAALWVNIPAKPILDIPKEEWDRVLDVNINGMFLCSKAVVPQCGHKDMARSLISHLGARLRDIPTCYTTTHPRGPLSLSPDQSPANWAMTVSGPIQSHPAVS